MVSIYYLTTEKDNFLPTYVGVTKRTLKRRLCGHISDSINGNTKIHNWIKSRMIDGYNICIELIDEVDISEAYFWEDFYIDLFKSFGYNIKNMLYSGYSLNNKNIKGVMSKEAREKLSKLYKNKKIPKEQIDKSIRNRLEEAKRRGYYFTEETKRKISKSNKGKVVSNSEKIRLREIRKLVTPKRKEILALDVINNRVLYFISIANASIELNCIRSNISKVISGERPKVGNYYFCSVGSSCPIKIPLNGETPEEDNPVLNQCENIVNA